LEIGGSGSNFDLLLRIGFATKLGNAGQQIRSGMARGAREACPARLSDSQNRKTEQIAELNV